MVNENTSERISQAGVPSISDFNSKICITLKFVRSFIFLGSLNQDRSENSHAGFNEQLSERILRSIFQLFEYLRSNEGLNLEYGIIKNAMQEIHRLFDSKAMVLDKQLIIMSLVFLDNLLLDIYKTTEINMVKNILLCLFLKFKFLNYVNHIPLNKRNKNCYL